MKRNLEQELDEVKRQLSDIKDLLNKTELKDEGNSLAFDGLSTGGSMYPQDQKEANIENLLLLIENQTVEKVLHCVGNSDRLTILLTLLQEPMTVAKLIERCGYNSTGQVYHHLKPLMAAGLVTEDRKAAKGVYTVQASRMQGIILFLTGISQMISPGLTEDSKAKVTKETWGGEAEIHRGATMVDERYMATAEEVEKTIKIYFSSQNPLVLKSFPARQKKKIIVLGVIAKQFTKNRQYNHKEVDAILSNIFEDYATIRRYLIEYGFMERTQNGGSYWLT